MASLKWIRKITKWLKFLFVVFAALFLLLLVATIVFPDAILKSFAESWSVATEPEKADAIFVLGGGNDFRPAAAAKLWEDGFAGKVYVFRAVHPDGSNESTEIADETTRILIAKGVDEEAIILHESAVSSTYEEAQAVSGIVRAEGFSRVLIPTHLFHTRRVKRLFTKTVGCDVIVTEADYIHFRSDRWWKNEWGFVHFPNEILKTIFYWLKY